MIRDTRHWYAVQTKPRQESVAAEHMARQRYEIYLPKIRQSRRQRGFWRETVEPLFPRYLFVRTDPLIEDLSPIRSTRGVIGLVRFGQQIVPVPDVVVNAIKDSEDAEECVQVERRNIFRKGEIVRILEGPLEGLEGIFEAETGEQRALILLEALGKISRVYVERNALGPAI